MLSRLPAKTVGRFRCVSKHWQTLLSDPKFLKIQFSRNNHQTKVILHQDFSILSVDFRKDDSNSSSDPVGIFETLKFEPTNIRYTMRGSCNGLILLYDYKKLELSIANPITHESRQLPPFPKGVHAHFCKFGFGYCSNDDEYTVVIISDHTRSSRVYMLKRNKWKRVEKSPVGFAYHFGTFVNGAIHWLYSSDSDHSKRIYAFDLAGEKFREVEQPEGLKKEDVFVVHVLEGCLCLIVCRKNLLNDMWVMKEYGVRESWTKYVACSLQDYRYIQPLFFWNGDESIVAVGERKFIWCCLKQETSGFIPVIGEGCPELFYEAIWTFVDSLFSLNSSNAVEGPSQVQV